MTTTASRSLHDVGAAIGRLTDVLARRPAAGLHDDSVASAQWDGGLSITTRHANGTQFTTDMPPECGGSGTSVTPGWLFRAGIASCATTVIATHAAARGIALQTLEIACSSRSDTCGMLGLPGADGRPAPAAAFDMRLHVRIGAANAGEAELRALVDTGVRCSPAPSALSASPPVVTIEIVAHAEPAESAAAQAPLLAADIV